MNKENASPDIRIGGCHAVIQSGLWKGKDQSWVYNNLGNAYSDMSQYDRAIQHYDQAIRLNPNYADAFYNRGIAYEDKGEHIRAIQVYDQAIKLNPKQANAIKYRSEAIEKRKSDY